MEATRVSRGAAWTSCFSYYMLRSMGVRVPAWVARNITTMQILQFVVTHFILFHVGYLVSQGVKVDSTPQVFW